MAPATTARGKRAPSCARSSMASLCLEIKPQAELNDSRQVVLLGYLPKATATAATCIGRTELGSIENVEEFRAELQIKAAFRAKRRVLEERHVEVRHPVGTDVRFRARIIPVAVIRRCHEGRCIEPMGQLLGRTAGGQRLWANSVREGAAHVVDTGVA